MKIVRQLLLLLILLALLPSAENPGAPRGAGRSPYSGGFGTNVANPPGRVPPPRLPPIPGDVPPTLEQLLKLSPYDFDPALGIYADGGFTLWTLDDLGQLDPAQQPYLRMEVRNMDHGAVHLVVYLRDAPGFWDMFLLLRYHHERYHPRQIEPGSAFGYPGDRLFLAKLDVPGLAVAGFSRIRPDLHGPTKLQDGVVCEIVLEERPFDFKPEALTHAPEGRGNQPENVQMYFDDVRDDSGKPASGDPVLYWEESNVGDYNNDGEVMVTDILPVGRRYGRLSTDGDGDAWDWMTDGNRDTEVNYRDQWLVQEHYGSRLTGYRVYRRPNRADAQFELLPHRTYPVLPMSIHRPKRWEPTRRVAYRYFDRDLPLTSAPAEWTYRIVPYDFGSDTEGVASALEFTVSVTDNDLRILEQAGLPAAVAPAVKYPEPKGRT